MNFSVYVLMLKSIRGLGSGREVSVLYVSRLHFSSSLPVEVNWYFMVGIKNLFSLRFSGVYTAEP